VVSQRPRLAVLAGGGAALTLAAWALLSSDTRGPTAPVRAGERARPDAGESPLPVIGFNRVEDPQPDPGLGERDLFDFATPPPPPYTPPPPTMVPATMATPPPVTTPTPVPLPPMNIKYIGAVERRGAKVAMLLTDKGDVLTGQPGDVVGNRFRIVKIGLESVDVQEVGSDQVRRIPLRGN
jgi:hypothetical protein